MKNNLTVLLLTTLVLSFFGCSKKEVNGEIFVVTKGAGNVKLGLVTVYFLTEEQYKALYDTTLFNRIYDNEQEYISSQIAHYQSIHDEWSSMAKKWAAVDSHCDQCFEYIKEANQGLQKCTKLEASIKTRALSRMLIVNINLKHEMKLINDKTNSDGIFKIELLNQKYWVFAKAERQLSDEIEEYHWLFEYTPDDKPLYLSNDNMK